MRLCGGAARTKISYKVATVRGLDTVSVGKTSTPTTTIVGQVHKSLYIVEKIDEVPEIEVTHLEVNSLISIFKSNAVVCRFNGFWPKTEDLHNWIHSTWTTDCDYYLCAK